MGPDLRRDDNIVDMFIKLRAKKIDKIVLFNNAGMTITQVYSHFF